MAKTLKELLEQYGSTSISDADLALGRDNAGALDGILQARQDWSNATTQEEKDAAHNRAENIRKAYGNYSGDADGMGGQYSPTYVKPTGAAENDNVKALYEKFSSLYGKNNAPTWTPQYQEQINEILGNITNRDPFEYDMMADPLYQQHRDQYIREGQRAMKDTAAQAAAMTGGYGSTYGAIAAQQGYDNYLAGLNDVVPQLEQQAYGKHMDELADLYNQMGAYQSEENRLYGQYLDQMDQFNIDRDYAFNAMQAAIGQNNYENEVDRGIFESDRDFNLQKGQIDLENAMAIGDLEKLAAAGYDISSLQLQQELADLQAVATMGKLQGTTGGTGGTKSGGKTAKTAEAEETAEGTKTTNGYTMLVMNYKLLGDTEGFEQRAAELVQNGQVTRADYEKFLKEKNKW